MENKKSNKKIYIFIIGLVLLIGGLLSFFIWKDYNDKLDRENDKVVDKDTSNNKDNDKGVDKDTPNNKDNENVASSSTPLLYEVTKNGYDNKVYLFGSIHMADDRAYPMNDKIMEAYNSSDSLGVEFDIVAYSKDFKKQMESMQLMLCEENKTLADYLDEETYEMLIKYLKDNKAYNKVYEVYRPALLYSLVSNIAGEKSNLNADKGIDNYFLNKAKKDKKEILELESPEFQYNMLLSFPDELYDLMIRDSIAEEDLMIEELKELYEAWLKGDATGIADTEEMDAEDLADIDENILEMIEDYNYKMLTDRNNSMTKKVDGYFNDKKNVFVVVGAAHIVGEDGLADQLQKLGYSVKVVEYNS